jgi:hypothetical protein
MCDATPEEITAAELAELERYPDAFNIMEPEQAQFRASRETREKLSVARKAMWADPAYRERLKASHAKRNADPEYRARHRAAMLAFNATPEGKAVRSKVANDTWAKEGARERRGEKTKALWDDPEHRDKQRASRLASASNPEVIRRRSEGIKRAWDALTPQQQAERIEARAAGQRRAIERRKAAAKD